MCACRQYCTPPRTRIEMCRQPDRKFRDCHAAQRYNPLSTCKYVHLVSIFFPSRIFLAGEKQRKTSNTFLETHKIGPVAQSWYPWPCHAKIVGRTCNLVSTQSIGKHDRKAFFPLKLRHRQRFLNLPFRLVQLASRMHL